MKEKITSIISQALKDLNKNLENPELENPSGQLCLAGTNGNLDSLSLVSFIVNVERRVSEEFEKDIFLVDERAMLDEGSPFRTVESLSLHIENLLKG